MWLLETHHYQTIALRVRIWVIDWTCTDIFFFIKLAAPWYVWIGGILGAYYVIINILTVPRLGTATVLR
jgi:transporter family-2 protein